MTSSISSQQSLILKREYDLMEKVTDSLDKSYTYAEQMANRFAQMSEECCKTSGKARRWREIREVFAHPSVSDIDSLIQLFKVLFPRDQQRHWVEIFGLHSIRWKLVHLNEAQQKLKAVEHDRQQLELILEIGKSQMKAYGEMWTSLSTVSQEEDSTLMPQMISLLEKRRKWLMFSIASLYGTQEIKQGDKS